METNRDAHVPSKKSIKEMIHCWKLRAGVGSKGILRVTPVGYLTG